MEPEELETVLDEVVVVDVRTTSEWEAGRIDGARHLPMDEVIARLDELDPEGTIVAVCRSGARSGSVVEFLRARGYDAHNLEGGMLAWAAEHRPITAPDGGDGYVV